MAARVFAGVKVALFGDSARPQRRREGGPLLLHFSAVGADGPLDNVFFGKGEKNAEGVSTRKVSQITEQLCGTEISATQVSRIAKLLDTELEQFRERELQEYRVVYLDAHYEKVRVNGTVQDLAILKALGVNRWGKRKVLGVSTTLSEAEVHWREFLQALQRVLSS